ncbi:MAG TPA: hypothetical protein VLD62_01070 [Acidimicrobiia bacterium]|nr:hypothetical protein [Acidimicrobiia bacterium]
MTRLLANAWTWVFRGLRTRNPALTAVGGALAAISWIRRSNRGRELLWAKTLAPGESYRVRLLGPEGEVESELDIGNPPGS